MSRHAMKTALTLFGIGLLIVSAALEAEAGRGKRSFGRSGGGRSFSRSHGGRSFSRGRSRGIGRSIRQGIRSRIGSRSRSGPGRRIDHRTDRGSSRVGRRHFDRTHRPDHHRPGHGHHDHGHHDHGHHDHDHHGHEHHGHGHHGHKGHGWGFGHHGHHHHHHHFGRFGFGFYQPAPGLGFAFVSGDGYGNPYCDAPIGGYNYSSPVDAFDPSGQPSTAGRQPFDAAIAAFKRGDYETARRSITLAVKELPHDGDVHQFHGLVLFAQGDYRNAAAVVHASLTVSTGWNWPTLRSFYSSADVYTAQLRLLENARTASPNAAELRFLLGYHYLMLGHKQSARTQLGKVIELQPDDELARQLLNLTGTPQKTKTPTGNAPTGSGLGALARAGSETAQTPQGEAQKPIQQPAPTAASLSGTWTARPGQGVEITLTLKNDSTFTWKVVAEGTTDEFGGRVTISGSTISLTQADSEETLEGTLTVLSRDSFQITLGKGTGAPELVFNR